MLKKVVFWLGKAVKNIRFGGKKSPKISKKSRKIEAKKPEKTAEKRNKNARKTSLFKTKNADASPLFCPYFCLGEGKETRLKTPKNPHFLKKSKNAVRRALTLAAKVASAWLKTVANAQKSASLRFGEYFPV